MAVLVALSGLYCVVATSTSGLVPPRPLSEALIAHPADAPAITEPIDVVVKIRVDEFGEVVRTELIRTASAAFDRAVLEGATNFIFTPGTFDGAPVPVDIVFTQRFVPETPPPEDPPPRPSGILAGKLEERGTRDPIPGAMIVAAIDGVVTSTESNTRGEFQLILFEGTAQISVGAAGFRPFVQTEQIVADQKLEVLYLVEREGKNPYEVTVRAQLERDEIARTSLRGRDIAQIPGTFGDPFRVVSTLPGVSQLMSLLPYPVVRGSSP